MVRQLCSLLIAVSFATTPGFVLGAEMLRIGAAETEITPPLGYPVAGYYSERLATGTRDPLKAKAIVFHGEGASAALVVCDLTGIAVDLTREVRKIAAEKTGIPADRIVLSATHSHTAPDYQRDLYMFLGDEAAKKQATEYPATLIARIAEAIVQAHAAAEPATIQIASAKQETPIAFNRRFVMRDGAVRTWMGLDNPEVVRAAGPIDPEVGVMVARTTGDKPLAALSNFALHLDTVGGTLWSADYPYYVEQAVRRSLGDSAVSIFGNGCCGDINHIDPSRKERNTTEMIGTSLGATVVSAFDSLETVSEPRLAVRTAVTPLPLQLVSSEEIPRAESLIAAAKRGENVDFFDHVTAYKNVLIDHLLRKQPSRTNETLSFGLSHAWAGIGETLPVEVQVIAIGRDLAIVCLPGEVFVNLGLAIKQASPFRQTMVIELSSCDETIYIPTRAAYAGGSYEVTNSTTQPGSGEMLVETSLRLLREAAGELK
jgi:hypothetical protein